MYVGIKLHLGMFGKLSFGMLPWEGLLRVLHKVPGKFL